MIAWSSIPGQVNDPGIRDLVFDDGPGQVDPAVAPVEDNGVSSSNVRLASQGGIRIVDKLDFDRCFECTSMVEDA